MSVRKTLCASLSVGMATACLIGCSRHEGSGTQKAGAAACNPAPFVNDNGTRPPGYNGPFFQLSHAYPEKPLPPLADPPWQKAIGGGQISVQNAGAYVQALKDYVAAPMRKMLLDPGHWNAAAEGWYNEPWTGCQREPLHGMYVGTTYFPVNQFPGTGLAAPFTTYVLTYYDRRSANTLYNVWGASAENPTIGPSNSNLKFTSQFAPGSVVVKAAFATANGDKWPPMASALQWPAYININATKNMLDPKGPPQLDKLSFLQFDIIVKDQQSARRTGWVFTTLVYDKDAPGADVWDKMVPLGAMWGNDPEVNNAKPNPPPLRETWINSKAPLYATRTLGWGGRLSGPNDGALNNAIIPPANAKTPNLPSSSCMACHISAQWPMKSFLLPTQSNPPQTIGPKNDDEDDYLVMWAPGSPEWMRWFQSPAGTQPMDAGSTPFDYDMVFAFKSLKAWHKATHPKAPAVLTDRKGRLIEEYSGKPSRQP